MAQKSHDIPRIGRCGYAEPTEDGDVECRQSGKTLIVRNPLGYLVSIVRCRRHSDWLEAHEEEMSCPIERT